MSLPLPTVLYSCDGCGTTQDTNGQRVPPAHWIEVQVGNHKGLAHDWDCVTLVADTLVVRGKGKSSGWEPTSTS